MAEGSVIAVTGASRGIGSCIVAELAGRGFTVGCLSRKGVGLEDKSLPPDLAARCIDVACDVTDEAQVKTALQTLADQAGRIDGLVNNAGLYLEGRSHEVATADFERVLATNVTGPFIMSREAYPHLLAAGGGTIINLGSFFGRLGTKSALAYTASKAAIDALTRSLAVEWAKQQIRVLCVAPGFVATDLNKEHLAQDKMRTFLEQRIPTGGPCEPEEIARLIAMLLSEDLPFLTGETIYIDGGQGIAH